MSCSFNSGQNLHQDSSDLVSCYQNDPQQKELVQDTENVRRSNRRYGKSQVLVFSPSLQQYLRLESCALWLATLAGAGIMQRE